MLLLSIKLANSLHFYVSDLSSEQIFAVVWTVERNETFDDIKTMQLRFKMKKLDSTFAKKVIV